MAGILDLTPGGGLRTVGMRERDFRYPSLHGKSSRPSEQPRKPSPPINAPPRGSSSDEESDEQTIPYGEASDDSEFGGSGRKKNSNGNAKLATGTGSSLAEPEEDDKKNELSVEPSNIRAVTFTSGRGPGSRNGSQSSQKRKDADVEDDEMPMSFSQHQKKPKHGYGHNNVNIHKGSVTKPNNPKKAPLKETEKAGPAFKKPNTDAMLAQCDKLRGRLEESEKHGRWETRSTQTSQRNVRASQRSSRSTQESSQTSVKSFKQPPRPSPRKVPEFRASPVIWEDSNPPRATRSLVPAQKAFVLDGDNSLKSSKLQSAANIATDRLGISNMQINISPSATRESSAPPTSIEPATTMSSPLSSLGDSTLTSIHEGDTIITSNDIPIYIKEAQLAAVCPMCKQPVEKSYLEGFNKAGTRMSLRQQAQFCMSHKERSAESEWVERGYPEIDWQQLDTRIAKYYTLMDDILSQRKLSFYRNAFEDSLKSGKNRTLQECLLKGEIDTTSPGYYGGRGAKVMADNIMSRFASKLRRLAASDKLISSGGVSRYVQAVLVPELAVLLIQEDMKVDEEKAREILRDSVDIGNLLNEEEDETITNPAPKEQELVDML